MTEGEGGWMGVLDGERGVLDGGRKGGGGCWTGLLDGGKMMEVCWMEGRMKECSMGERNGRGVGRRKKRSYKRRVI